MSENGLICDSCHAKAEETDTECWNCGHTTFVYEPGNAKNQTPHCWLWGDHTDAEHIERALKA